MRNKKKQTLTGVAISKSGDKTVKVSINYKVKHPKYGKYVKHRTTLAVHDEHNNCQIGDTVEIIQSRPYSKTKGWRIFKILEKTVQK